MCIIFWWESPTCSVEIQWGDPRQGLWSKIHMKYRLRFTSNLTSLKSVPIRTRVIHKDSKLVDKCNQNVHLKWVPLCARGYQNGPLWVCLHLTDVCQHSTTCARELPNSTQVSTLVHTCVDGVYTGVTGHCKVHRRRHTATRSNNLMYARLVPRRFHKLINCSFSWILTWNISFYKLTIEAYDTWKYTMYRHSQFKT